MKIYVGYLESLYQDNATEAEDKLSEAKMNVIKEKAKINDNILIEDEHVYMLGDLTKELGIDGEEIEFAYRCDKPSASAIGNVWYKSCNRSKWKINLVNIKDLDY